MRAALQNFNNLCNDCHGSSAQWPNSFPLYSRITPNIRLINVRKEAIVAEHRQHCLLAIPNRAARQWEWRSANGFFFQRHSVH